jgi:hypothetical protein
MKDENFGLCLHPRIKGPTPFGFVADWKLRLAEIQAVRSLLSAKDIEPPEVILWRKRFFSKPIATALLPALVAEKVMVCELALVDYKVADAEREWALVNCKYVSKASYNELRPDLTGPQAAWERTRSAYESAYADLEKCLMEQEVILEKIHTELCSRLCPWRKRPGQKEGTIFRGWETYTEMLEKNGRK